MNFTVARPLTNGRKGFLCPAHRARREDGEDVDSMAAGIALYLAWTAGSELRRERLSGLAIVCVRPDATAFLANNTRVDLQFSVYKCEDLINPKIEVATYRDFISTSTLTRLNNERWDPVKEGMTLSPGERLPIHLTTLVREETFVSLVALRVVFEFERRTRYWVYRLAGTKAADSPNIRDSTHPHGDWVLELGGEITCPRALVAFIKELFAG